MKTVKYIVPVQELVVELEEDEFERLSKIEDSLDLETAMLPYTDELNIFIDGPYFEGVESDR